VPEPDLLEVDLHFVRDRVAIGDVRVLHVPTTSQFVDIFTKGLPSSTFSGFRSSLSVSSGQLWRGGGGGLCVTLFLCGLVLYRCTGSPDCGGVSVYLCEWPIWPVYNPYRGPCIANYIPTLLGLEEYTRNYSPNMDFHKHRQF
jgi:hypothetical protein